MVKNKKHMQYLLLGNNDHSTHIYTHTHIYDIYSTFANMFTFASQFKLDVFILKLD